MVDFFILGIVEEDEECDCGTIRDCESLDPCCISRGHKNSCRVNKKTGIDCHPSQGMCCNSKCKYNDLLNFGLVQYMITYFFYKSKSFLFMFMKSIPKTLF